MRLSGFPKGNLILQCSIYSIVCFAILSCVLAVTSFDIYISRCRVVQLFIYWPDLRLPPTLDSWHDGMNCLGIVSLLS
jgi:hypothetical protein